MSQKKKKDNNIYVEYITLLLKAVLDKGYILEEGKAEGLIEVAKNLIKLGSDIDFIQTATGLDAETIKNL